MTGATSSDADAPQAEADVPRFAVRLVAAPAAGFAVPGLTDAGVVAVTDDGTGVAQALADQLGARGIEAAVVETVPADARAVLVLDGLRAVSGRADVRAANEAAFDAARQVAATLTEHSGVFITVQDTGGTFGFGGHAAERAGLGGLAGLAKTASLEWPQATVKALDVERGDRTPEAVAEALVQELLHGGPEREVALAADGTRRTLRPVPAPLAEADTTPLPRGSVFVVSGGAKGVTAASIQALAAVAEAPRFVLLGRTPLEEEPAAYAGAATEAELKRAALMAAKAAGEKITPKDLNRRVWRVMGMREVRGTLAALEAAGAEARYVAVDVRDADALQAELDAVRADWGPIAGLVHGAGVLADALLTDLTPEAFDRVFSTKVEGLYALLDALQDDPLRVLCFFSSVAARTGNKGQAAYAMANEVLNKIAHAEARHREDCLVRSLGWGPWDGGMVSPVLKAHFEAQGITLVPLDGGAQAFARDVRMAPDDPIEVLLGAGVAPGGGHDALPPEGLRAEVTVHADRQPYLDDHRIQGRVVLPVVQVVEWFARLAGSLRPGPLTLRDVRVLRGVQLDAFDGEGHRLRLQARPDGDDLALTLLDADGTPRFTARATPGADAPAAAPVDPDALDADLAEAAYAEARLFHGPAFQVLRRCALREDGAEAELAGVEAHAWPQADWKTDAAALDGALQLALLWSEDALGGPSLPMRLAEVALPEPGALREAYRVRLTPERTTSTHTRTTLVVTDEEGTPLVALRGVEMYLAPSGT